MTTPAQEEYQIHRYEGGYWIRKDGKTEAWAPTLEKAQDMAKKLKNKAKYFTDIKKKYGKLNKK